MFTTKLSRSALNKHNFTKLCMTDTKLHFRMRQTQFLLYGDSGMTMVELQLIFQSNSKKAVIPHCING